MDPKKKKPKQTEVSTGYVTTSIVIRVRHEARVPTAKFEDVAAAKETMPTFGIPAVPRLEE